MRWFMGRPRSRVNKTIKWMDRSESLSRRAGTAVAAPLLIIQVSPEVGAATAHAPALAQRQPAAAMGTDRLCRRLGGGGERLVGVGVLGDFHRVRHLLSSVYVTPETAVWPILSCVCEARGLPGRLL